MISQSKNNDKQKELLEAALELFVAYGFHGTPTSKIAEKAGVANGTLFHYFKTKDELVLALYIDLKSRMATYLHEAAATESTLEGKFRSVFVNSLHWAMNNKTAFQFLQQFTTSPFLSKISPEVAQEQLQDHFELIAAGIKAKLIKAMPVDYIYTLTMGHIFGLFQYLCQNNFSATKQKKTINESFDLFWLMLK